MPPRSAPRRAAVLGPDPGADRAAARLELRAPVAAAAARRLGLGRLDPEARKSFEVALHAGTAAALLIGQRREIAAELAAFDAAGPRSSALSFIPPAIAGYRLERQIEGRLGGPRTIAAGLARRRRRRWWPPTAAPQQRGPGDAGAADGLALGVAQAAALIPGVSRNGATLTAARARRFTREHANLLSRTVALPVIVGATVLKGVRLRRRGVSPGCGGDGAPGSPPRSRRRSPRSG